MKKNRKWTIDNMPDMSGKIAIVTGANSGIGYATARALAAKGAQVIMACRNEERGRVAIQEIQAEQLAADVEWLQLDLADLSSIHSFVQDFLDRHDQLHLLINNAGVMQIPDHLQTADGFEMQFGTNHLGHFALTGLLLETLNRTPEARVVTLSSFGHRFGKMDFDNLNSEKSYNPGTAYAESKLANLLFTYELQRRFNEAGVQTIATAAHPGWTETNLQKHQPMLRFLNRFIAMQPDQGALPTLYAATAPAVTGGAYYGPDGLAEVRGYPKRVNSNDLSHDQAVTETLWAVSEELTGVRYPF
jgi:NAD(P)-dependent dehydrogenase (short-subunit alcohol dehydrogenase family)